MAGAVIIVIVLVIVLPVAFMLGGAVVAALLGLSLRGTVEADHEGSELIDTNY